VLFSCTLKAQDKFNLGSSTSSRFEVTNIVWPDSIGEANVCLWNDDKLSAVSITIDDNNEQDIPFWKTMQKKYDFTFTWFLITEASEKNNVKCWSCYQDLADAGNAIQGHDDRNWFENCNDNEQNTSIDIYSNRLKATKKKINNKIKNQECVTYAYPWGQGLENESGKIYIATRGVIGLLNQVNQINYNRVNSISNPHIYSNKISRDKYVMPLITQINKLEGVNYYRGWLSTHFHGVESEEAQVKTGQFLSYLKDKEDKLWVATFPSVVKYSQEYVTHHLKVYSVKDNEIILEVSDEMQNQIYNFPLTIKVRISNDWKSLKAKQNNNEIESKFIYFKQNTYVLIKAIPDDGMVKLTRT
jgi:hypothetical protein